MAESSSSCSCTTAPEDRLPDSTIESRAEQLKALASPVRLQMVDLIYYGGGEVCVCELQENFDLSQPTISHHLKVLREAGLIQSRQEGTFVYHRVDASAFTDLSALMDRLSTIRESNEAARAVA
ncbi:ArsR/SmtB family transcription factor [Salinibacter altiplanensis]|uniref:ArsR/SmtB family transcription factor n=1 Tax=Salinibacter altiplanensis TaxID=1803181 RepID=UPI000C9EF394|nr:metalloregulator ArsR/SmtB family transcription factor [Salinibacter altiplanensis]